MERQADVVGEPSLEQYLYIDRPGAYRLIAIHHVALHEEMTGPVLVDHLRKRFQHSLLSFRRCQLSRCGGALKLFHELREEPMGLCIKIRGFQRNQNVEKDVLPSTLRTIP